MRVFVPSHASNAVLTLTEKYCLCDTEIPLPDKNQKKKKLRCGDKSFLPSEAEQQLLDKGRLCVPDLLSWRNLASLVEQKSWSSLWVEGRGSLERACSVEMQDGRRWTTDRNSLTNASISCKVNPKYHRHQKNFIKFYFIKQDTVHNASIHHFSD